MEPSDEKPKSKSLLKRELQAIHDLGKVLVDLPDKHLAKIPVSESLREAICAARGLKRGALQRQLRYVGGMLANEEHDIIRRAVEEALRPGRDEVEQFHRVEKWRDKLLAAGDEAINEIHDLIPTADRQKLRRLVRTSHQEDVAGKPPRSSRLLFTYLRELLDTVA